MNLQVGPRDEEERRAMAWAAAVRVTAREYERQERLAARALRQYQRAVAREQRAAWVARGRS